MKKLLFILLLLSSISYSQQIVSHRLVKTDSLWSLSGHGIWLGGDSLQSGWWRGYNLTIPQVTGQVDTNKLHRDTLSSHNNRINSAIQRGLDTASVHHDTLGSHNNRINALGDSIRVHRDTLGSHNNRINSAIQRGLDSIFTHRTELNALTDSIKTFRDIISLDSTKCADSLLVHRTFINANRDSILNKYTKADTRTVIGDSLVEVWSNFGNYWFKTDLDTSILHAKKFGDIQDSLDAHTDTLEKHRVDIDLRYLKSDTNSASLGFYPRNLMDAWMAEKAEVGDTTIVKANIFGILDTIHIVRLYRDTVTVLETQAMAGVGLATKFSKIDSNLIANPITLSYAVNNFCPLISLIDSLNWNTAFTRSTKLVADSSKWNAMKDSTWANLQLGLKQNKPNAILYVSPIYTGLTSPYYTTIQSAITAATSGQEIIIDSATYTEDILITGKTGLKIRGLGQSYYNGTIIIGGTIIKSIQIQNSTGITICDLGIVQTTADQNGFQLDGGTGTVRQVVVENVLINAPIHNLLIEEHGNEISDIKINNCKVYGGLHGIIIKAENVTVTNCLADGQATYSYAVISDNIQSASVLSTAKDVIFDNCRVINAVGTAMIIRGTDWFSEDNSNNIVSPTNISLHNCNFSSVSNIIQIGEYSTDIYPKVGTRSQAHPINVTISDCIFYNSLTHALVVFHAQHVSISNCIAFNNTGWGFLALVGDSLTASNCQSYGNGDNTFAGWTSITGAMTVYGNITSTGTGHVKLILTNTTPSTGKDWYFDSYEDGKIYLGGNSSFSGNLFNMDIYGNATFIGTTQATHFISTTPPTDSTGLARGTFWLKTSDGTLHWKY